MSEITIFCKNSLLTNYIFVPEIYETKAQNNKNTIVTQSRFPIDIKSRSTMYNFMSSKKECIHLSKGQRLANMNLQNACSFHFNVKCFIKIFKYIRNWQKGIIFPCVSQAWTGYLTFEKGKTDSINRPQLLSSNKFRTGKQLQSYFNIWYNSWLANVFK